MKMFNKMKDATLTKSYILEWNDAPHSKAHGWLVIDSIINNVCGGGTFIHENCSLKEVCDTAYDMTYKNFLNPIPFGGAKAGIKFSANDPEALNVLSRFMQFNKNMLETVWVTGADLNTKHSDIESIVKTHLGMKSPFEALGKMYSEKFFIPDQSTKINNILNTKVNDYFNLVEAATGYVLAKLIAHSAGNSLVRLLVQGFGATGSSLVYFTQLYPNITVVGIADVTGCIINQEGIDIANLFKNKGNATWKNLINLHKNDTNLGKWYGNNFQTETDYLTFFLKNVRADCISLCANRYALGYEAFTTIKNHTFSDSDKKMLYCGANSVFENSDIIPICFEHGFNILPTWFTSSGNSLLFANLLSGMQSRSPMSILQHIAEYLINILVESERKYNSNPYIALLKRHDEIRSKY